MAMSIRTRLGPSPIVTGTQIIQTDLPRPKPRLRRPSTVPAASDSAPSRGVRQPALPVSDISRPTRDLGTQAAMASEAACSMYARQRIPGAPITRLTLIRIPSLREQEAQETIPLRLRRALKRLRNN